MYKRKLVSATGIALVAGLLAAYAGVGGAASAATAHSKPLANLKIMVGGLSKQIYLPNMLAQKLGYFRAEGLNVTLIDEGSGQASEEEVVAGAVDAGSGSYNHTIELQAAGKSIESVVQLQLAPGEAEMVASKEAGTLKTARSLIGKNLGVTELGSGTQTLTQAILGRAGVKSSAVNFVPVGAGATFIAAMQQGKIDAGMTTEPTITQLLTSGTAKVLFDLRTPAKTKALLGGNYPFVCVFMQTSYVKSHQAIVQRLVDAYVKTLEWIHTHTAAQIANKMPADYYAGDKKGYIAALNGEKAMYSPDGLMPKGGPQTVLGIENKYVAGMIGKGHTIKLAKTYTNQFAEAAN